MNWKRLLATTRCFSTLLVSLYSLVVVDSAAAQTIAGIAGTSPVNSMVLPESPTTEDSIDFKLNAGGQTHSNQCGQLNAFGGHAFELVIDEPSHTIQIGVTGPASGICTTEFAPVNGLEGSLGTLTAGDWLIQVSFPGPSPPSSAFSETLSFTVRTTSVVPGDVNLDGAINFGDVVAFVAVLLSGTFQAEADINEDGVVNFFDIGPFIEILISA